MAGSVTFNSASGGNWSVQGNWLNGLQPTTGSTVNFVDGTYTSTADGIAWDLGSNSTLDEQISTVTLDVYSSLTVETLQSNAGLIYVGGNGHAGLLTVTRNINGNSGTIYAESQGIVAISGTGTGNFQTDGGTIGILGNFNGSGRFVMNGGTVALGSSASSSATYDFGTTTTASDLLFAGLQPTTTNTITNAAAGDLIGILGANVTGATLDTNTHNLTITTTATTYTFSNFNLAPGQANVLTYGSVTIAPFVTYGYVQVECFAEGTRIETPRGRVEVELLREGDEVLTLSHGVRRLVWTGHQTVRPARQPETAPVRVTADAIADNVPARDVVLSPEHCVFLEGVLVPVGCLVNGISIRTEYPAEIRYYHLELAEHDVLLAEGMPCESFLDSGNRDAFDATVTWLRPAFGPGPRMAAPCAPVLRQGPVVEGIYAKLLRRAGAGEVARAA